MNEYLRFYEKYKISPVVQDIKNFKKHAQRRSNLYRQLSVPSLTFKDKDILEIGPGGGYNALVTYTFNPKSYTLVEPNSTGFDELKKNFKEINQGNIDLVNLMLEDFIPSKQFDIVMCEGLLPGLSDKENFINSIKPLIKDNGIFIMTTADHVSMLFELIRKYMADILIQDIVDIKEKVSLLVEAFSSHLNTLKGMTRSHEDWCLDNLIGDSVLEHTLTLEDALRLFENEYYVLGTSPDLYTNSLWYKELPTETQEYNEVYRKQFVEQWHNLMDYRMMQKDRNESLNITLGHDCLEFITAIKDKKSHEKIIVILEKISINISSDFNELTVNSLNEAIELLKNNCTVKSISEMKYFNTAFGRGQSYISFVKNEL